MSQGSNHDPHELPCLSTEIWREIASFLPRRDLRSLTVVPHALSPIARRLLFRDIHLRFRTKEGHKSEDSDEDSDEDDPNEINNKRHAQHSAELLHLLVSDAECASHVRKLEVWALVDSNDCFPIFMGAFMFPVCITLC